MSIFTCEQTSSELVASLDGELGDDERRPVADHVATCLACRRELERLTTVQRWVATLPPVAPSATFAADFWRRVAAEPTPITSRRRGSPLRWAVPALAAAAVLLVALRSQMQAPLPPSGTRGPSTRVAAAPPAPAAKEAPGTVARQAEPEQAAPAAEPPPQVANVESLRAEDLPPELLEHPELFLRLPVVRRLEKLEYLGATDDRPSDEGGAG
jgi:anti-sigma factor RsiW